MHRGAEPAAAEQAQEFPQHAEADAAQNDAARDHQVDHRIIAEGHQIVGAQGEARVAEGGNSVENRAEGVKKAGIMQIEQHGGKGFDTENQGQHLAHKSRQIEIAAQQGLADRLAVGKRHVVAPEQKDDARIGHDAQAAQLDQEEQHALAQGAEHRTDVHGREPGDADRRGRQKAGVQGLQFPARMPARRQAEQHGAQGDGSQKGEDRPGKRAEQTLALHCSGVFQAWGDCKARRPRRSGSSPSGPEALRMQAPGASGAGGLPGDGKGPPLGRIRPGGSAAARAGIFFSPARGGLA